MASSSQQHQLVPPDVASPQLHQGLSIHHHQQQGSHDLLPPAANNNADPTMTAPRVPLHSTAAMEVLRLLGFVLDMWSRHRESLRSLACGGDLREEEAKVLNRLGWELREVWSMYEDQQQQAQSASSWSSSGEEEEEVAMEEEVSEGETQGQGDGDERGEQGRVRKKRKRAKRKRRGRRGKRRHDPASPRPPPVMMEGGIKASTGALEEEKMAVGSSGGSSRRVLTMDQMPDEVLLRVVDMLGTPPPSDDPERGCHTMASASFFLSELTSMAQVCHRWKRVVRSSDVWKSVCEWRWPWLMSEVGCELVRKVTRDPRHGAVVAVGDKEKGKEGEGSVWLDLCLRTGHCLWKAGFGRSTGWKWMRDYLMMVDIFMLDSPGRRLVSAVGVLDIDDAGDGNDDKRHYVANFLSEDVNEEDAWHCSQSWPLEEVFEGHTMEEALEQLEDEYVAMEVMLINRRSNKMAAWYTGVLDLTPEDPDDPQSLLETCFVRHALLPNKYMDMEHCIKLSRAVDEGGLTRLAFESMNIRAPEWMIDRDFLDLFEGLDWV